MKIPHKIRKGCYSDQGMETTVNIKDHIPQ